MKSLKKVLAILVVAMMILASVSALAEDNVPKTFEVPVTKTLYFENAQGAQVYEPMITYNYSVRGATETEIDGATITDAEGHTAAVKPGNDDAFAVKTLDLVFTPNHKRVTVEAGKKVALTKKNHFNFSSEALKNDEGLYVPGVYRYIITENTTVDAKKALGISELGNPDKTLVLDVFVKSNGDISGATIHEPGVDPDDDVDNDNDDDSNPGTGNTDETGKTTGFGDGDDPTDPDTKPEQDDNDPTKPADQDPEQKTRTTTLTADAAAALNNVDQYVTYNMEVNKTVSGDMADATNPFPFSVAIKNSVVGAPFSFFAADNAALDYGTTAELYAKVKKTIDATATYEGSLKATETFWMKGIPMVISDNALTAKVTETNNLADTYKTTADFNATALEFADDSTATLSTDKKTATAANNQTAATADLAINNGNVNKVHFDNNLEDVSPTGVVLRVAPYLAMLAAGLVIVMLARRKHNED